MKGQGPAVSATSAPIPRTVRDLTAIFDPMITAASSPPCDARALTSMAADIAMLSDEELVDLAVSWRLHACRGDREAFGPAHALEVEQRRRHPTSSVMARPALRTMVMARPWWQFWRDGGVAQMVTFR